jgi:3D (Asp-Asp-Asp) domain-containing protein
VSAHGWIATVSTAYCLIGTMADGSWTRDSSVAHNGFALGTRITVSPPFRGHRRFVVRDRIGWGTELDFWTPTCASAFAWGRRVVRVHRGWARTVGVVKRMRARYRVPRMLRRLPR